MFVYIPSNGQGPQLFSADDLSTLSVRAAAGSAHLVAISPILQSAGAGEVADGYVWLDISWLQAAVGESTQEWRDQFDRMLDYASANSWVSADGRRLRAHVDLETSQDS